MSAARVSLLPIGLATLLATAWPAAAASPVVGPGLSGWPLVFAAACGGALIALGALVAGQRIRNARELAALRRSLTAAADCWWRTDAQLRIVEAEPGDRLQSQQLAPRLLGRRLAEIAGPAVPPPLRQALDARAPFFDVVLPPLADTSGTLALSGTPLHSSTGQFDGYAGVLRDVATLAGQLNGGVAAAGADGEHRRALELATRELDSFSHSISHDLRAPLRVVDGFATIVLEDYAETGKPLDDVGRDHIRRIIAAGGRMNAMIDTLLALSRVTSRELARERVDLSQLAREQAEDLTAQDGSRPVAWDIAPALACDGDRTLLSMVLQNLLGNAWKFTGKAAAPRIAFGAQVRDGQTVYFVRDNGAGFDMRFADKLFGLFQRFHSSNEFPGTGVGLATVARIVRKHGGRIWAEAAPGQGATFYFTLWEAGRG